MKEEKVDLDERRQVYGEFVDNMERTALIWSGILGFEVKDYHVPLMMLAYKAFRSAQAPRYSDNTDDIEGWRQGLLQVVNENYGGTIQARDVTSYLEQVAAEKTAIQTQQTDDYVPAPEDAVRPDLNAQSQEAGHIMDQWLQAHNGEYQPCEHYERHPAHTYEIAKKPGKYYCPGVR